MLSKNVYTKLMSQAAGIDANVSSESTFNKLQYDSNKQSIYIKIKNIDRKHLKV